MTEPYTPTTSDVRSYLEAEGSGVLFDRWLTAHDAEVAAKALESANEEREELAQLEIALPNGYQFVRLGAAGADAILAAGYRKNGTVTNFEESTREEEGY